MNLPFEKVPPEQFDTLYNINIRSMFFLTQAILTSLLKSKGVVINLTSVHIFSGSLEHSVYAGTKGAIVVFTRELSIKLAQKKSALMQLRLGLLKITLKLFQVILAWCWFRFS